jgi:Ca2+-binding EF-hand superfamily protein
MFRKSPIVLIVAAGMLLATRATPQTAPAQSATSKVQEKKLALGEDEVKKLLLLMDADKNGRISKQEYMSFMEKEFERLDVDKSGDLDVKELTQSSLQAAPHKGPERGR